VVETLKSSIFTALNTRDPLGTIPTIWRFCRKFSCVSYLRYDLPL
jgi:hypothetical protein